MLAQRRWPVGAAKDQCPVQYPTVRKTPALSAPPAAGAQISDVIAWIEAGHPADPARYHSATRDGVTTQLGNDITLSSASGPPGRPGPKAPAGPWTA